MERWSLLGGDYFGMNFGDVGVVFAKINASDYKRLEYNTAQSIAADATLDAGYIGKTSWSTGDNLIGIPKEYPNRLYHLRWNVKPAVDLRVLEWFETTQTGNLENDTRSNTADFGFLTGELISEDPHRNERIIPYMTKLQFSFYNKRSGSATPELDFDINEYVVQYVNPDIQTALFEDLLFGNIDRSIFPMGDVIGGLPGYRNKHEIQSKLGVLPMPMPEYADPRA
jgi:hypothetical protein